MYEIIWLIVPLYGADVWTLGKSYPLYLNKNNDYEFVNDKGGPTVIGLPESWTSEHKDISWIVRRVSPPTPEDYSSLL